LSTAIHIEWAADPAVQAAAIARLPDHLRRHADAKAFAGRGLLT
jgi:hypothetical protein